MKFEHTSERTIDASATRTLTALLYDMVTADPWETVIELGETPGSYRVRTTSPTDGIEVLADITLARTAHGYSATVESRNPQGEFHTRFTLAALAPGVTKVVVEATVEPSDAGMRGIVVDATKYNELVELIYNRVASIADLLGAPGRQLRADVLSDVSPLVATTVHRSEEARVKILEAANAGRPDPIFVKRLGDIIHRDREVARRAEDAAKGGHLRRLKIMAYAAGPAHNFANRTVTLAALQDRWQVNRYAKPESWVEPGTTGNRPKEHLLFVPTDANARNYPSSINGVRVRIIRATQAQTRAFAVDGSGG